MFLQTAAAPASGDVIVIVVQGVLSQCLACVEPVVYSSVPVPVLQGEAEGGGKQSPSVALRAAAPDRLKRAAPAGVSRPSGTAGTPYI